LSGEKKLFQIISFKAFEENIICHNKLVSLFGQELKNESTKLLKQLHKIIEVF